jgi:peptidoglycan/LPS O-acetylase OafA/YrhL
MPNNTQPVYFSGLNGLRFFAAFAVIVTHIELLKPSFGFNTLWFNPFFQMLGSLGVYFFFVLSGFLITFLLLTEREKTGNIQIKKFYIRRILRIWPLYFLMVVLGFFILPQFELIHIPYLQKDFELHFQSNLILYLFILPNLALSLFTAVPHIGQLWSIGIEEQFYIFWPLIVSKSKNIIRTLIYIIVILVIFKTGVLFLGKFAENTSWYKPFKLFVAMSKFECMAFGGLGAYFLFIRHELFLRWVTQPVVRFLAIALMPVLIYTTPDILEDGIHLIYSVLFLIIIVYVSQAKAPVIILENKVMRYLGSISYGIYMYHFFIIAFVLYLTQNHFNTESILLNNLIIYILSTLMTIAISAISYEIYEKQFVKLKRRFSPVLSGQG